MVIRDTIWIWVRKGIGVYFGLGSVRGGEIVMSVDL